MNRPPARRSAVRRPQRARAVTSGQQARTDATRRKLLAAAENIFARDGFEAARLEDIAGLAGYTRGAFYANFQSKEDIFFVCFFFFFFKQKTAYEIVSGDWSSDVCSSDLQDSGSILFTI
jgi:AcrR family transcriptional regulator